MHFGFGTDVNSRSRLLLTLLCYAMTFVPSKLAPALFVMGWLFSLSAETSAQQRQLVLLTDKAQNSYSLSQPEEFLSARSLQRREDQGIVLGELDLPVSDFYLSELEKTGAQVVYASRWLNAVMVIATTEQLEAIDKLTFVKETGFKAGKTRSNQVAETCESDLGADYFGNSLQQSAMLGIDCLHHQRFKGKNVHIAILDNGFSNANTNTAFQNTLIAETYDFVDNETAVYDDQSHGLQVLSIMAANLPGTFVGVAPEATYHLYRTEDNFSETKFEEFFWLLAAERADSAGVDVINSSLEYYDFDSPFPNYVQSQLDGNTALITKAADWAARTGMLVVSSAGNSTDDPWGKIGFPADADSILTVGAVNAQGIIGFFSGIGPTADNRIKPDVVAMGVSTQFINPNGFTGSGNGTSYSAPIVAGFVALLRQKYPLIPTQKMISYVRLSGDKANNPDSVYGYGLPSYSVFSELAMGEVTGIDDESLLAGAVLYPNPATNRFFLQVPPKLAGENITVQLHQLNGQHVQTHTLQAGTSERLGIELPAGLPRGMYLVKAIHHREQQVFRLAIF